MSNSTVNKKVIDLSGWNEVQSYEGVKAAGIDYVILKAINKGLNTDKKFEQHWKCCSGAGIAVIGTYHYSYATTVAKAKEAAKAWIKTVNGRCSTYYLDWEDASLPKDSRAVDIINVYADEVHKTGGSLAVYCSLSWYNSYLKKYAEKLPYEFWIARYYAGYKTFAVSDTVNSQYMPSVPNLTGWQYTASGTIAGINGNVDISIWYKDISAQEIDSTNEIPIEHNPYTEPKQNVALGTTGNDANWVLWYLWRFGLLLTNGMPDAKKINGIISTEDVEKIKKSQKLLGTTADGVVGKITRGLYTKIC